MYTIEYYETKKEKPEIKEPEYLSENKRLNYMKRRRYLHQKDLIDKCWNVKSLTIDLEDIKHVIQDKKLSQLYSLYASVRRLNLDDSIRTITIQNNSSTNLSFIYKIINCKWMVNANEELDPLDVLKTSKKLLTHIDNYNKTSDQRKRRKIKNEMDLIKYYLDTAIKKSNNEKSDMKTIKIGKTYNW